MTKYLALIGGWLLPPFTRWQWIIVWTAIWPLLDSTCYVVGERKALREIEAVGGDFYRRRMFDKREPYVSPPPWLERGIGALNSLLAPEQRIDWTKWRFYRPVVYVNIRGPIDASAVVSIGRLRHLRELSVESVTDADCFVGRLVGMKHLEELSFSESDSLTVDGLKHFRKLPRLTELEVPWASIGDEDLKVLAGHQNFRWLVLAGTKITDESIDTFKSLPKLNYLNIMFTDIDRDGYEKIQRELPAVAVQWAPINECEEH